MMTVFWLTGLLKDLPNHLVAWGRKIYDYLPAGLEEKYPDLHYRTVIVRQLDMTPREFIFRRYLTGSLLKAYQQSEDPYGLKLPMGLQEMSCFRKELLFTPTEKTESDDPVDSSKTWVSFPEETRLTKMSFTKVENFLEHRDIALIDSKEEAGRNKINKRVALGDELFTPDSSRFAWLKDIKEGVSPPFLDKQIVRDEAERLWKGGKKVPLEFSPTVTNKTGGVYCNLLSHVTDRTRQEWRASFD